MPRKPKPPPSSNLRQQLRKRIQTRLDEIDMTRKQASNTTRLTIAQMSRLCNGYDVFSLDRLVDAAECIGLSVEIRAVRPYTRE